MRDRVSFRVRRSIIRLDTPRRDIQVYNDWEEKEEDTSNFVSAIFTIVGTQLVNFFITSKKID